MAPHERCIASFRQGKSPVRKINRQPMLVEAGKPIELTAAELKRSAKAGRARNRWPERNNPDFADLFNCSDQHRSVRLIMTNWAATFPAGAVFQGQTKRPAPDESRGADEKPRPVGVPGGASQRKRQRMI
jgi:hypothetical protein